MKLSWQVVILAAVLGFRRAPAQSVSGNNLTHDPSTLIKDGNRYYSFNTGQGIPCKWSTNLTFWTAGNAVFPGNPPPWTTNAVNSFTGGFWAPDVSYFNGRYNLYYACSEWGTINSAIGLVTSLSLQNPVWTDQGKVIQSDASWETDSNTDLTSYNCIDPAILLETNGTVWMSFGSYSDGILVMQLDPATGKRIAPNSPITKIANNGASFFSNTTEGSFLYHRGAYYYLFLNFGGCCSGIDSTYNIRVGRSLTITGPYRDKNGVSMLNGGGTMLLESTGKYIGPGHAGILDENGTNWFSFHYYDGNSSGTSRLGIMQLTWTPDNWPTLTNDWCAFYPFESDARDDGAQYDGQLKSGASITNELDRTKVANLNGTTNYISLPNSVVNANTFSAWVKWNGGAPWQRIFDFGNGVGKYMFLTPSNGLTGKLRFGILPSGGTETVIDAPISLPTKSWCHVAVTLDGAKGLLYLNGVPVATNNVTARPWQLLARTNSLGSSQFGADPYFNGEIDSFRVYGRTLTAAEILQLAEAHPALAHRYSFDTDARDSIGAAHGALNGNAFVSGGNLSLDGTTGTHVKLPGGLVNRTAAVTLEFWATFAINGAWPRVFDFGNTNGVNGQNFLFFTPHTGSGSHRLTISTTGGTRDQDVNGTYDERSLHVVCVIDPANGYSAIYTNGVLENEMTGTLPALSTVGTAWSFIGKSLFAADGWLNANIDEFRIYDARLTPQEIAANADAGPNRLALPVTVDVSNAFGLGMNFSWPSYAVGYFLESSATLGPDAIWTPVAGQGTIANGVLQMGIQPTNEARYYRLRR